MGDGGDDALCGSGERRRTAALGRRVDDLRAQTATHAEKYASGGAATVELFFSCAREIGDAKV